MEEAFLRRKNIYPSQSSLISSTLLTLFYNGINKFCFKHNEIYEDGQYLKLILSKLYVSFYAIY